MSDPLRNLAAVLALTAVSSAQHRVLPYPVTEPPSWQQAVANGTRSLDGARGPKHWDDFARYRITASLDPATATVHGHAEMTYVNRSPERLDALLVHLRQNLFREGAVRNRFVEITGGVSLGDVELGGETARYRVNGTVMRVAARQGIEPGAEATLTIDWSFVVPKAGRAPRMGQADNHVFYLGQWYPQFAVHDDVEGWVADQYLSRAEFYMPYADYDVTFSAPAGFLVRATGTLQNPEDVLTGTARERLAKALESDEIQHVIDADDLANGHVTKPAADGGTLSWHFTATNVRDVAVSVSDRYLWDATRAKVPGRDTPCAIHAVYEARSRTWPRAAEYARQTIEWMSANVFPYPWPHMTACEGIIGGGMEYPMMTLVGDSRSARGLQGVISHELIHMWFPMTVGTNEKWFPWMDEGTTSFFTTLVGDAFWKRDTARARAISGYVAGARRGGEWPMMTHGDYFPSGYTFASYSKPSALLHQLRELLRDGDRDVLMEAIRTYVDEWKFSHPTPYDFFRTIERVAGRDLDWYWRPWYFETWTLDHAIQSVSATEQGLHVLIADQGLVPFPCTIAARWPEGRTEVRTVPVEHWLEGATTAEVEFPLGAAEIVIDPDRKTLDVDRDDNTWKSPR